MDFIWFLGIFSAGLLVSRQAVVRLAFGLALVIGILLMDGDPVDVLGNLLVEAWRLLTGV